MRYEARGGGVSRFTCSPLCYVRYRWRLLHPGEREIARTRNRIFVLLAAFLFSTGGAAIKATSFTGWQVAGFRSGIAALVLWIAIPEGRRNWNGRSMVVGIAYAATLITFVSATKLTTSANAIFLQDTAPLYMLLIGPLLL